MPANLAQVNRTRFWTKVQKTKRCWVWRAGRFPMHGYGQFHIKGYGIQAHRVSWFLHNGKIPAAPLCILHKCDNRLCVRPSHLFVGTKADNNLDTISKRRHRFGQRHWKAVLSSAKVRKIRRLYKQGFLQRELAVRFGVGQPHISDVVRGKSWRILEG